MALVLDTGVLVASMDARDRDHDRCSDLLRGAQEDLVIPSPVLVEVDQLLESRGALTAWVGLAARIDDGAYGIHHLAPSAVSRATQLQLRYEDLRIGFVDAAVFVTCVDLGEDKVATLDRRHFSVLRTEDGQALEIVPE